MFFSKSLNTTFKVSIILLILTIIILNIIPLSMEKTSRETEMANNIKNGIELQHLFIENWIDKQSFLLQTLSTLPIVKTQDKEKMLEVFRQFVGNNKDYSAIVYVNKNGYAEIDTGGVISKPTNLSNREYFLEAKKGNPHITDVITSKNNGKPIIIFSMPIYNYEREFQGLIFGSVYLAVIEQVLDEFTIGETGKTYLLDKNGVMIKAINGDQNVSESLLTNNLDRAIQNFPFEKYYKNHSNVTVMGDYKWVNDKKWLIIGEIEKKEVLSPFYKATIVMIVISFIVFIIAYLFMSKIIYRRIHSPISYVLDGAKSIINGQYNSDQIDKEVINNSPSELKELCDAYNEMSTTITSKITEIKESEEKFRTIISTAKDAIIIADIDMNIISWNKSAQDIFGYKEEEILGRSLKVIEPEKDLDQFFNRLEEYIKHGEAGNVGTTFEIEGLTKSNTLIPIEISLNTWNVNDHIYFCGIIRDITQRKNAEKALSVANKRFKSVFENAGIGIALAKYDGVVIECNAMLEKMLGYNENELLGLHISDVTHPEDLAIDLNLFGQLINKEINKFQLEKRYITKDGHTIWGKLTVTCIPNDLSEVGYVIGMIEDITIKKESEQALRDSKEFFSNIVETTPNGVVILDEKGKIIFANTMTQEILGLSESEITSRYYNDARWKATTLDGKPIQGEGPFALGVEKNLPARNIELNITRDDDTSIFLSINATPLFDCNHQVTGVVASIIDITERIKNEQKIKEANKVLQELSIRDGLTGILNRRHFDEKLSKEWRRHLSEQLPLSIILFDIDFFKIFNDTYGHQEGDDCLIAIASTIDEFLAEKNYSLARYGGEEFVVILSETNAEKAVEVAEQIRLKVQNLNIENKNSPNEKIVTVSVGVATTIPNQYFSHAKLLNNADKALYKGKKEGRNQVNLYEEE